MLTSVKIDGPIAVKVPRVLRDDRVGCAFAVRRPLTVIEDVVVFA